MLWSFTLVEGINASWYTFCNFWRRLASLHDWCVFFSVGNSVIIEVPLELHVLYVFVTFSPILKDLHVCTSHSEQIIGVHTNFPAKTNLVSQAIPLWKTECLVSCLQYISIAGNKGGNEINLAEGRSGKQTAKLNSTVYIVHSLHCPRKQLCFRFVAQNE